MSTNVVVNKGVEMPAHGFGVFQTPPRGDLGLTVSRGEQWSARRDEQ